MVGQAGLEPATPRLSSACSNQLSYRPLLAGSQWSVVSGLPSTVYSLLATESGGKRTRTVDPLNANQVLYQLSYTPVSFSENEKLRLKLCTVCRGRYAGKV